MGSISTTVTIDISIKEGVMENINLGTNCTPEEVVSYTALFKEFCDVFAWIYEEMPGIDPSIIVHEIKTYPDAKPVRQKLHPVHPKKFAAIKVEVEKLLKSGFIYPVPLTQWVSNLVPVAKKQGTIRVCVDYQDLNKACPKDNYLLTGEIVHPSTGRVEPVRGCLNNPSRLVWTTLTSLTAPLAALRSRKETEEKVI
jgi:hypothetical protein